MTIAALAFIAFIVFIVVGMAVDMRDDGYFGGGERMNYDIWERHHVGLMGPDNFWEWREMESLLCRGAGHSTAPFPDGRRIPFEEWKRAQVARMGSDNFHVWRDIQGRISRGSFDHDRW